MDRKLKLSETFNLSPKKLYDDWLSSEAHSAFTGSPAEIDPEVGGKFTAWEGYIWGETKELEPGKRILQTWRTSEFPEDSPDSLVEITFESDKNGTLLTLLHTNIPAGQSDGYEEGWHDFYFTPMKEYYK